jgi:hypothetical protein
MQQVIFCYGAANHSTNYTEQLFPKSLVSNICINFKAQCP